MKYNLMDVVAGVGGTILAAILLIKGCSAIIVCAVWFALMCAIADN